MTNFEFTEPVQAALQAAEEEAILLGHDYIGTEHILLGLDRDPSVRATLEKLGLTSERLRAALEWSVRRGKAARPMGDLPFTSRAKKVLDFSALEAQDSEGRIAPRHLLLALLREDKGIACEILTQLGVTAEQIASSAAGPD
jgi:ATP-dependent Clp protease ATP-binding subunit ClpC